MQQKILIVGATSGLGKSLSKLYCKEGAIVGAIGRRKELLDDLKKEFPQNLLPLAFDICEPDTFDVITRFIEQLKGIDKLILTASIVDFNPSLNYEIERNIIGTNVIGYSAVLNAAFQHFKARGHGHIAGVTSIAAARGNNKTPAYNASKSFQSSYLESLRLKCLNENIQIDVTELIPGYIDTDMAKGERLFWIASLDKAARQAKKAIDNRRKRVFITRRWKIVFMIYRFLPSFLYTYLINSGITFKKRV